MKGYKIHEYEGQSLEVIKVKDIDSMVERYYFMAENNGVKKILKNTTFMSSRVNTILGLKDIGMGIDSACIAQILREIKKHNNEIPTYYESDKLGWNNGNFYGAMIVGEDYELFTERDCLQSKGELTEWVSFCRELIEGKVNAQIIVAAGFASCISGLLGLNTLILSLSGDSSIGKTIYSNLATSIWSCPKDSLISFTFNSTIQSILERMSGNSGINIIIDDTSKGGKIDYEGLIYQLEDGQSRMRLEKDYRLSRLETWNTTVILSSEISICSQCTKEGILRRIIELPIKQGTLTADADEARLIQKIINKHYGLSGYEFTRLLFEKGKNYIEKMYLSETHHLQSLSEKDGVSQGLCEKQALIVLCSRLLNEFFEMGIDVEALKEYLLVLGRESITNFSNKKYNQGSVERLYNALIDEAQSYSEYEKSDSYNIPVNDFNRIVQEKFGLNPTELKAMLSRSSYLLSNANRLDRVISIKNKTVKCVSLKKEA